MKTFRIPKVRNIPIVRREVTTTEDGESSVRSENSQDCEVQAIMQQQRRRQQQQRMMLQQQQQQQQQFAKRFRPIPKRSSDSYKSDGGDTDSTLTSQPRSGAQHGQQQHRHKRRTRRAEANLFIDPPASSEASTVRRGGNNAASSVKSFGDR